jgi:hypothetical protein
MYSVQVSVASITPLLGQLATDVPTFRGPVPRPSPPIVFRFVPVLEGTVHAASVVQNGAVPLAHAYIPPATILMAF